MSFLSSILHPGATAKKERAESQAVQNQKEERAYDTQRVDQAAKATESAFKPYQQYMQQMFGIAPADLSGALGGLMNNQQRDSIYRAAFTDPLQNQSAHTGTPQFNTLNSNMYYNDPSGMVNANQENRYTGAENNFWGQNVSGPQKTAGFGYSSFETPDEYHNRVQGILNGTTPQNAGSR